MISLFFGTDTIAVRAATFQQVSDLRDEGKTVEVLEAETYERGRLSSLATTTTLFGEDMVYVLDTPSLNPEAWTDLMQNLSLLQAAPHIFLVIELGLAAADKKKLAAAASSLKEFQAVKTERFNIFSMSDALLKRDRRTLWLLLISARQSGVSDEEIIGVLWWQLKTLRLAAKTKTAAEAGLKDFPFNKAKRNLINFKSGELEQLSLSLLKLYHDGHSGRRDLSLALEAFVLTI
jgi:DNA polymerase III delta subunit